MLLCPCQSSRQYTDCCEPYHLGIQNAPTAEALMRSRYSAYALGKTDYLINTTHRDNPQYRKNIKTWRDELQEYCDHTDFLGLSVIDTTADTVTFEAKLSQQNTPFVLKEKSRFVQIGSRWLYHSGVAG